MTSLDMHLYLDTAVCSRPYTDISNGRPGHMTARDDFDWERSARSRYWSRRDQDSHSLRENEGAAACNDE
jgi:hypothetical protein